MPRPVDSKHTEHGIINTVEFEEAVTVGRSRAGEVVMTVRTASGNTQIWMSPGAARHLASVLERSANEGA